MNYRDNILLAFSAIRANMLRTSLTFSIIAFGIMALVGILTAVDSLKSSIYSNFSTLGSNTFTIRQSGMNMRRHGGGMQEKPGPVITYEQAKQFKERFHFPAKVSVATIASMAATVKYNSEKTNPNIQVWGIDDNYLSVTGYEIQTGRAFSLQEVKEGSNVILLGKDIVSLIF
ncbi:MAG: ABC transporter permease, partial [Bacteroidia bacterium]|nr:ABC transporter permease [Bacteroidia bacterium]